MGRLLMIKAGLLTTMQDLGRFGFRKFGVPVAGAMDQHHAQLANLILGNDLNAPLLEITLIGPELVFEAETVVCITGADFSPTLNELPILPNKKIKINQGDRLKFNRLQQGCRAYLAIKNGFQTTKVLGSCSWCCTAELGITPLKKGGVLFYESSTIFSASNMAIRLPDFQFNQRNIPVMKGPEYHKFSKQTIQKLLKTSYKILARSNRMAYALEGEPVVFDSLEMLSSAVQPGTVQLPPSGLPIVLMRDGQTIGGYPRIFQVTEEGIDQLAQLKSGSTIQFTTVECTPYKDLLSLESP